MKKVGILTINDYRNYGNRLQNFAVQQVLIGLGVQPETIVNTTKKSRALYRINSSNKRAGFLVKIRNKLVHIKNSHVRRKIEEMASIKETRFIEFTRKYIVESVFSLSDMFLPIQRLENYDYFVTGSDQVWNPNFKHFSEIDFLTFAPSAKRISYAASFGISSIPEELTLMYKEWINGLNHISVREDAGKKIIKEITGRDSVVLLDPTMMVDKVTWLNMAEEFKDKPKKKFLCTYFLGETFKEYESEILDIARSRCLEVVNLGNVHDLKYYTANPSEFLDFINSSEIFLTDSFHGCIFSILFERPFIVFTRKGKLVSMNSRIETLLSKFKLESRNWDQIQTSKDYFECNYSQIPSILEVEKEKTKRFLLKSFEIEG